MAHKKTIIALSVVLFAALMAVLPFFGRGFIPTHDGEYHVIRFVEFSRMLQAGYLFPRWAPTLNSGYGLPLFEFMYPMVNYIAYGLHGIGLGFVETFKVSSALGYLVSAFFCFLWLKKRFGLYPAVIGSIVGAFVPYWFVDLYVRGVIGEVWAIASLFAALYFIESDRKIFATISVAVLILSHNILAMLFFPLVIAYMLWRKNWSWLLTVILGMGLASWFWVPALSEAEYMQGLNTVNFRDHFVTPIELLIPSWGTEFTSAFGGSKMSFQIGIAPLLWIFISIWVAFFTLHKKDKRELVFVLGLLFFIIALTLPYTLFLWNIIPILQLTQYPWRLLVYLIPVVAYLSAVVTNTNKHRFIIIALTLLTVLLSFSYTRGAVYAPRDDAYYLTRQNFTTGTSSMGNSLSTKWTGWKQVKAPAPISDTQGNSVAYSVVTDQYLQREYEVSLDVPKTLRLHVAYFPGWNIEVDGVEAAIDYQTNGTLDIKVPAGRHTISATMSETPVRLIANILSILSLVVVAFWGILHLYAHRH